MSVLCPVCLHQNKRPDPNGTCELCGNALPTPPEPPVRSQASTPTDRDSGEPVPAPAQAPRVSGRYPKFEPLRFGPAPQESQPRLKSSLARPRPASIQPSPAGQPIPAGERRARPIVRDAPRPARAIQRVSVPLGASALEGTIIGVKELDPENRDPDPARILFSLLFVADLFILLGSVALVVLLALVVIAVLAAVLNMMWMMAIFGFIIQALFFFLGPIIGLVTRGRGPAQNQQPVTNYRLRTLDGHDPTFRIKGQLRGVTPQEGDRVRVWGRVQHGILRFREGVNLNTDEPLILPQNWSVFWLIMLVLANVIGFLYLYGSV